LVDRRSGSFYSGVFWSKKVGVDRIEELGRENGEIKTLVTVSLGVASVIPDDKISTKELIGAADRALYKAKEGGRNKVVVWKHQQE
jgi:diguanylate cyclase (GGDEF)-like protein